MRPSTFSSGPKEGSHNETHNETDIYLLLHHQSFHKIGIASSTVSASGVSIRPQDLTMKQLIYLCQEMSRDVKICQEMSRRYDKICQDMSGYVKICQDISRYDIS